VLIGCFERFVKFSPFCRYDNRYSVLATSQYVPSADAAVTANTDAISLRCLGGSNGVYAAPHLSNWHADFVCRVTGALIAAHQVRKS
jgi:hypothetical protein